MKNRFNFWCVYLLTSLCTGNLQGQDYRVFEKAFKNANYSLASEVLFQNEVNGKWVNKSTPSNPNKLVLDYTKYNQYEGFRAVRYLETGEMHYDFHSTWDGHKLKVLQIRGTDKSLHLKESLSDMEVGSRLANVVTLPWFWLMIPSEDELMFPTTFQFSEETEKRFRAVEPYLKSGEFFELPYAKGIECRLKYSDSGMISGVVVRSMNKEYERSLDFVEWDVSDRKANPPLPVPKKIVETLIMKGLPRLQRTISLLKVEIGSNASKELLQIDVSKADSIWDPELDTYLPLNRK